MTATLGIAASPGSAVGLAPLAGLVGHGHRIVSWHRVGGRGIDAVLASDAAVLRVLDPTTPVACGVRSIEEARLAVDRGAKVLFTTDPELARVAHADGPEISSTPAEGIDVERLAVIAPLTRAQMRAAHGLPDPLVLAVDRSAPAADRSTSLALASAAVVDVDLLPLALALGTPTVTDPAGAARFGLTDGVEVVVEEQPADADRSAAALARDVERAAAMSVRARRFAERHLDLSTPARRIRQALGLVPPPSLIDLRLSELATPPTSRLRVRADDALSLFTMETPR